MPRLLLCETRCIKIPTLFLSRRAMPPCSAREDSNFGTPCSEPVLRYRADNIRAGRQSLIVPSQQKYGFLGQFPGLFGVTIMQETFENKAFFNVFGSSFGHLRHGGEEEQHSGYNEAKSFKIHGIK